jgi:signal transduction histidine kinase
MSTEDRGQIFDEFYQARTPLHATAKGNGLGLSFVQRVATALGATIEVSTELGAGSTFVVVLPSTPEGRQP